MTPTSLLSSLVIFTDLKNSSYDLFFLLVSQSFIFRRISKFCTRNRFPTGPICLTLRCHGHPLVNYKPTDDLHCGLQCQSDSQKRLAEPINRLYTFRIWNPHSFFGSRYKFWLYLGSFISNLFFFSCPVFSKRSNRLTDGIILDCVCVCVCVSVWDLFSTHLKWCVRLVVKNISK